MPFWQRHSFTTSLLILDRMNQVVPNRQNALVEHEKIIGYLLSSAHPVGRNKARIFARCGYDPGNAHELTAELKRVITNGQLVKVVESQWGLKYIVDGMLHCYRGSILGIRTVWIIETDSQFPRFVTAYPV